MSLDLIAATSTLPGLATAGTQTMGGDKTFTGSTQFLRASATAYSATTFPPNPGTTYVNSTNSGTVSQVFAVRDVSTVAQYMSFTTYSPANAQVDFVIQSTLSGTTKEILRATGAGAWAWGVTGVTHVMTGANLHFADTDFSIGANTANASDTKRIIVSGGGGGGGKTRGAYIALSGNEYGSSLGGQVYVTCGDAADSSGSNTAFSIQGSASTGAASADIAKVTGAGAWFFGNPSAAAQGITLQGNDAGYTASALKYYQEGSFTPTFTFSTPGSSSSSAQGYYVRIGRLVQFQAFIQAIVTTGASGGATLTLPFAGLNAGNCYVTCVFGLTNSISVLDKGLANPNTSVMSLLRSDGVTAIVASDFGGSAYFAVTVTYMIN